MFAQKTYRTMAANRFAFALATSLMALFFLTFPAMVPVARAAVEIQEVKTDSGLTAWLVEDYTVPIIAVRFSFTGGSTQDPAGKEGLTNLMSGLFDEGAGEFDSEVFQQKLDETGVEIGFSATRDAVYGQMRTLAEERDNAFEFLRLALNEPRFDQAPVDRIRAQIITAIQSEMRDPMKQGTDAFRKAVYGDHPYARLVNGTVESLQSITQDDLRDLHKRSFARSNLHVAVVGAIDAETLKVELDRAFSALPEKAQLSEIAHVEPKLDQVVEYNYPLPQTMIHMTFTGLDREDPEYFAAVMMNHILGGGTFTSRLWEEVREKRGLTYGVSSALSNGDYSNSMVVSTSTRADRAEETLEVIRAEINRIIEDGVTEEELQKAKTYVIGSYPINNLDSSSAVARTLLGLQEEKLGIDYIERRADYINAVTTEQVKAVAKRLLTAEPAILLVGPEKEAAEPAANN